MILAIDTATQYAGLALYNQDGLLAEEFWFAGRRHTTELAPRIVRMLKLADMTVSELDAIAISVGPGSFTGVRIGLAVAKGLALPHKLPVIGIPTLDIVAYPFRNEGRPVWAIAEAGRGRILAARYSEVDSQWQATIEPYITTFEELSQRLDTGAICSGEINQEAAMILDAQAHQQIQLASPANRLRRAGYLAEIAAHRYQNRDYQDAQTLVPIYASSP